MRAFDLNHHRSGVPSPPARFSSLVIDPDAIALQFRRDATVMREPWASADLAPTTFRQHTWSMMSAPP